MAEEDTSKCEATAEKALLGARGYSDSAVPTSRCSPDKEHQIFQDAASNDYGVHCSLQDTKPQEGQPHFVNALSSCMNARQNLQLPSFKSLGIAIPYPSALLTPPDDDGNTIAVVPPSRPTTTPGHSRHSSFPPGSSPKASKFIDLITTININMASANASTSVPPATSASSTQATAVQGTQGSTGSTIVTGNTGPPRVVWISQAVDIAGKSIITRQSKGAGQLTKYSDQRGNQSRQCCQRTGADSTIPSLQSESRQPSHDWI